MNRVSMSIGAVVCVFLVNVACAAERPNILYVLTEDQGAHLSLLGTPGLKTPHMDSLAKSGTYFSNAIVVTGWIIGR